jgi:hypothetical protein
LNLHGSYPASTSTQRNSQKPRRFSLRTSLEARENPGVSLSNWETPGRLAKGRTTPYVTRKREAR